MANTLTSLSPDLYQALDVVSRELVGLVPSVTLDSGVERAAVGQTVRSFVTPQSVATDTTPSNVVPDDGDQTIANKDVTISKVSRYSTHVLIVFANICAWSSLLYSSYFLDW